MEIEEFYAYLEDKKGTGYLIPRFDFSHGASVNSSILFLLESPGPQVRKSRLISLFNKDQSAANLRNQLAEAEAPLEEILLWNVVPWISANGSSFDTPSSSEIAEARPYNIMLFDVFENLSTIVFVGRSAQKEIPFYSGHASLRLLAAHHPSAQAMCRVPQREIENVAVFGRLRESHCKPDWIGGNSAALSTSHWC